jgi:hypothetical protein
MTRRRTGAFVVSASVHLFAAMLLVIATRPSRTTAVAASSRQAGSRDQMTVFVVPPEPSSLPGLRPSDDADDASGTTIAGDRTVLSIPGLTLNFKKVAARSRLLFPPIAPGLALEQFLPARESPGSLPNPLPRLAEPGANEAPPLSISRSAEQAIVDKAWSRHERWQAFQNLMPLLTRYSANDGDLPHLLQVYSEQNGLQPFVENGVADAKLWAQLAVAADHVDFIGAISHYASERPASRATTNLLLVLDTLVQSNLEVLLTLLSLDPVADLQLTRRANTGAFDFLVETQRHYRLELARRHLESIDAVKTYYDAIRLAILDTVVRTTPAGYRSGDARFLMGALYWRQGNMAAAIDQWRAITKDDSDSFALFYSAIIRAVEQTSDSIGMKIAIDRALTAERSLWKSASYDRLKKFGYRFDTF